MNAKRLIVTFVFAIVLIGFFIWIISAAVDNLARNNRIWKEKAQDVTAAVETLNNKQYDIMYYGADIEAPQSLRARKIVDFETASLAGPEDNPEHVGHILILNDLAGDLPMTDEQWTKVQNLMRYDGYILIYFGSDKLPLMQEKGFFFDVYSRNTRSIIFWDNGRQCEPGFADNPFIIPEVVRQQSDETQLKIYAAIMKLSEGAYI
ncbi:MAG: hypothetical protein J6Y08_08625 [Clostridiales bacterium]|nr:hypothetical protein [Clostridiales bacterium]